MKNINIVKIMIPKVYTAYLNYNDTIQTGLEVFAECGYTALPVVKDNGEYAGCVTEGDFLRYILSAGSFDAKIKTIIRGGFIKALKILTDEKQVLEALLDQNFVPIVDDRNCLCGIITRRSFMKYITEKYNIPSE